MDWQELSQGMDLALRYNLGRVNGKEARRKVLAGEWMLFAVYEEGEPVVCLLASVCGDLFEVGYCWGTRVGEWITDVYLMFEVIGKELGCSKIAFNGRQGWSKLAKQHGFRVNSIIYVKDI